MASFFALLNASLRLLVLFKYLSLATFFLMISIHFSPNHWLLVLSLNIFLAASSTPFFRVFHSLSVSFSSCQFASCNLVPIISLYFSLILSSLSFSLFQFFKRDWFPFVSMNYLGSWPSPGSGLSRYWASFGTHI